MEKEKLEKLNHMLQENICKTRSAMHGCETNSNFIITDTNNNSVRDEPQFRLSTRAQACQRCEDNNTARVSYPKCTFCNNAEQKKDTNTHGSYETGFPRNNLSTIQRSKSGSICRHDLDKNSGQTSTHSRLSYLSRNGKKTSVLQQNEISDIFISDFHGNKQNLFDNNRSANVSNICSTPKPLDLSVNSAKANGNEELSKRKQTETLSKFSETDISGKKEDPVLQRHSAQSKSGPKLNRHAETQCGTPFVFTVETQRQRSKKNTEVITYDDRGSQTDSEKTPSGQVKNKTNQNIERASFNQVLSQAKTTQEGSYTRKSDFSKSEVSEANNKDTGVEASHLNQPVQSGNKQTKKLISISKSGSLCQSNQQRNVEFVKPIALPPKNKVRITPLISSGNRPSANSIGDANNSSEVNYDSDASINSEFDLTLVQNIKSRPDVVSCYKPLGHASNLIKSQNNVKKIDRCVEGRARNEADQWAVHPCSPENPQPSIPPRPAFSDCGTRRMVLQNPSLDSVRSHGVKRRYSLDDSGIHSPQGILSYSPEKQGSPVDSKYVSFNLKVVLQIPCWHQ